MIPVVVLAGTVLTGCGPHRDVMVFGTNTKVALDFSATPAGGIPDFTFGFKRQEMVYMPLLVNAKDSKLTPGNGANGADLDKLKYKGTAGQNGQEGTDTYSVFASFGGDFSGGPAGGSAGLAQFFATGIAAQRLGNNEEAATALRVQPANAALVDELQAQNERLAEYYGISLDQLRAAREQGQIEGPEIGGRADRVVAYVAGGDSDPSGPLDDAAKARLKKMLDTAGETVPDSVRQGLQDAGTYQALKAILAGQSKPMLAAMEAAAESDAGS